MAAYYTINMYPVQFSVEYPDGPMNRLSTLLRAVYCVPVIVILAAVSGVGIDFTFGVSWGLLTHLGGLLVLPTVLMLLFHNKYPRWWFDFNLALLQFANRVAAYLLLLTDAYPSTDEEQSVHLDIAYPDTEWGINRVMPLFKWALAIPHLLALTVLGLAVVAACVGAWFAILATGRYPRSLFDFVVGVMRWENRVVGYALILVTDQYPPFRLGE